MITASTDGAPNWVDLNTPDIKAAIAFYEALLDWTIEESKTPRGDYYIGYVDGQQVAGMMKGEQTEGMPPMWTVFFNVDDIEATVSAIESAGGSILSKPFDIPDARIAVATDSVGAMFAIFEGPEIEGSWLSQQPGGVCWVETMNRDTAGAESFYATVFGWKAETSGEADRPYTTFSIEETSVAGMISMPDDMDPAMPAHWSHYFTVADCAKAEAEVLRLGGSIIKPTEFIEEMGHFAVLADPQGAVFQVMDFVV